MPGARIDTVPFIEAVRQKRTALTKVGRQACPRSRLLMQGLAGASQP